MHEVEIRSKSLEDARKTAAFQLGVAEDEIEMEVLQEPAADAGSDATVYRVRARIRRDAFSPHGPGGQGPVQEPPAEGEAVDRDLDLSRFSLATGEERQAELEQEIEQAEEAPLAAEEPAVESPAAPAYKEELEENDQGEPKQEVADRARLFLEGLMRLLNIECEVIVTHVGAKEVHVELRGGDLGFLIGRYGSCLDSLQLLTAAAANRGTKEGARVLVDAEGYRDRRQESLERLALSTAATVRRTGKPVNIPNLKPHERRIIHLTLRDDPEVETYSEGEGRHRTLVIAPRRGGNRG